MIAQDMEAFRDERVRQVAVGAVIVAAIAVLAVSFLLGWRALPGLLGEWVGIMVGIMSTPVFLEISFVIIGTLIVLAVNHWRQYKDGDEFVYLDQVAGADLPADLPDQAKWALFREQPLEGDGPSLLTQAEGALAIGDHSSAAEFIALMNRDELIEPEVLRLRRDLAQATGRHDLVKHLEMEMRIVTQENQAL